MAYDVYQVSPRDFPGNLGHIADPPKQLYARGTLPPPGTKFLVVVGSRAISEYGKRALAHMISGLRGYPISIVSGLALGTDTYAHELALAAHLHTIGIPGSGLADHVLYPKRNRPLALHILAKGGALLSEYAPDFEATLWSFPKRNRIMAGLGDVVFMLEAGEKSGTLITARMASEYNRELCTIPHPLFTDHGKGPHQFLRLGATLVTEPEHLLEALGITVLSSTEHRLRPLEERVLVFLDEPRSVEDIERYLHLPRTEALLILSELEVKELIGSHGGAYVRLRTPKT